MSTPGPGAAPPTGDRPPIDNLLKGLDEASRELLLGASSKMSIVSGSVLVEQGSFVDRLFVIADGVLRAEIPDRHGLPFEVARFGPGDYCGEMSFLRGERASSTIRAITNTQVWTIPHAVLSELAERSPAIMRELAGLVAKRLGETNLRFRQLRPGHVVACVTDGSELSVTFLGQVVRSAAVHLGRPVLMVDFSTALRTLADDSALPDVASLVADPYRLQSHDAFARRDAPLVGSIAAQQPVPDVARLLHLISELQSRYPLVVVHAPVLPEIDVRLLDGIDRLLLIRGNGPPAEAWSQIGSRGAAEFIVLDESAAPARGQASEPEILRVVPASLSALRTPPARVTFRSEEPWRSVGWTARHLIRRKVGLALGSGGSKGYAHLGIVERLRELEVPVDYVAGCSIGAPIAAAVAAELPMDELERLLDQTFGRALRPTLPLHSFLSNRGLRKELERISQGRRFEDLPIPLAIVAVDVAQRAEVVFRSGDLAEAMLASLAIPGIFPPVRNEGRQLVDGALLNPIPSATAAEMGADIVFGVKLINPSGQGRSQARRRFAFRAPPIVDTIQNAFEVMQWKITSEGAVRSDITLEPVFRGTTGLRDFSRGPKFIEAGRASVEAARAAITELLPWVR